MPTRIGRLAGTPVVAGLSPQIQHPIRPELYAGRRQAALARAVGLTQFGVNHVVLEPGAGSALRHWHEEEDEFVFVLWGELTLVDDYGEHILGAGDFVGFPAGEANAHHLLNHSDEPAAFLATGLRKVGRETVHYPDDPAMGVGVVTRDEKGERTG
jgi:uncharacterized cupin superfamily protein